ncbi:MAG: porin, partial [Paramuribaculum sp.]|nr:porin [Paramuribaculum sp.]
MTLKTTILIATIAALTLVMPASLSAQTAATDNTPKFHATLRTRAELSTETGEYRFQVRNARAVLSGNVGPSVSYFINTDLCDAGKMKILDAWAKLKIAKGLYVQGGQFRMCFGVDPFVAPHQYYFSDRSFIGKQMCNYRRVGAKVDYNIPTLPLTLEAGIFNPTSIADHNGWNKRLDAAG